VVKAISSNVLQVDDADNTSTLVFAEGYHAYWFIILFILLFATLTTDKAL